MSGAPMLDWSEVQLAIFDLDGTLYGQSGLRRAMAWRLLVDALRTGNIGTALALREFRRVRERLSDEPHADFLVEQIRRTAARRGCSQEAVASLVQDWIETRPLDLLRRYRIRGVEAVFAALRRKGATIAILSDYPAVAKLDALGLQADLVVSASDKEVSRLKPDPRGIKFILGKTGVAPDRAIMIGDRVERDGEAARRADVRFLLRTAKADPGTWTFRYFDDGVFRPLIDPGR